MAGAPRLWRQQQVAAAAAAGTAGEAAKASEGLLTPCLCRACHAADWMLEVLAAPNIDTDFGEAWAASKQASAAAALVAQLAAASGAQLEGGALRQRQPGVGAQLGQLLRRNLRQYARLRQYQLTRLYMTFLIGLIFGWLYWDKASAHMHPPDASARGSEGAAPLPAAAAALTLPCMLACMCGGCCCWHRAPFKCC